MSEPQGAPAPTNPPVTPPPTAVAPPAAPSAVPQPGDESQPWFKERLEREQRLAREALLKDLGVDDPEKAKKAIADAKKAEEEAKSQGQKLGETAKTLESEKAERERLSKVVTDHAGRQIATLTEAQQAAVRAIAPDTDPAAQLRAIDALKPTWVTAAPPPAGATGAAPPPQPTPPAAGTAPPPNAPPPNGSVSPPDRKAEYLALKAKNPHAAAVFLNKHADAIYPPTQ